MSDNDKENMLDNDHQDRRQTPFQGYAVQEMLLLQRLQAYRSVGSNYGHILPIYAIGYNRSNNASTSQNVSPTQTVDSEIRYNHSPTQRGSHLPWSSPKTSGRYVYSYSSPNGQTPRQESPKQVPRVWSSNTEFSREGTPRETTCNTPNLTDREQKNTPYYRTVVHNLTSRHSPTYVPPVEVHCEGEQSDSNHGYLRAYLQSKAGNTKFEPEPVPYKQTTQESVEQNIRQQKMPHPSWSMPKASGRYEYSYSSSAGHGQSGGTSEYPHVSRQWSNNHELSRANINHLQARHQSNHIGQQLEQRNYHERFHALGGFHSPTYQEPLYLYGAGECNVTKQGYQRINKMMEAPMEYLTPPHARPVDLLCIDEQNVARHGYHNAYHQVKAEGELDTPGPSPYPSVRMSQHRILTGHAQRQDVPYCLQEPGINNRDLHTAKPPDIQAYRTPQNTGRQWEEQRNHHRENYQTPYLPPLDTPDPTADRYQEKRFKQKDIRLPHVYSTTGGHEQRQGESPYLQEPTSRTINGDFPRPVVPGVQATRQKPHDTDRHWGQRNVQERYQTPGYEQPFVTRQGYQRDYQDKPEAQYHGNIPERTHTGYKPSEDASGYSDMSHRWRSNRDLSTRAQPPNAQDAYNADSQNMCVRRHQPDLPPSWAQDYQQNEYKAGVQDSRHDPAYDAPPGPRDAIDPDVAKQRYQPLQPEPRRNMNKYEQDTASNPNQSRVLPPVVHSPVPPTTCDPYQSRVLPPVVHSPVPPTTCDPYQSRVLPPVVHSPVPPTTCDPYQSRVLPPIVHSPVPPTTCDPYQSRVFPAVPHSPVPPTTCNPYQSRVFPAVPHSPVPPTTCDPYQSRVLPPVVHSPVPPTTCDPYQSRVLPPVPPTKAVGSGVSPCRSGPKAKKAVTRVAKHPQGPFRRPDGSGPAKKPKQPEKKRKAIQAMTAGGLIYNTYTYI